MQKWQITFSKYWQKTHRFGANVAQREHGAVAQPEVVRLRAQDRSKRLDVLLLAVDVVGVGRRRVDALVGIGRQECLAAIGRRLVLRFLAIFNIKIINFYKK